MIHTNNQSVSFVVYLCHFFFFQADEIGASEMDRQELQNKVVGKQATKHLSKGG